MERKSVAIQSCRIHEVGEGGVGETEVIHDSEPMRLPECGVEANPIVEVHGAKHIDQ